jgi:hypothetical protein
MGLTTFLNGRAPQRGLAWLALSDTGYILSLTTTSDSGGGASTVWAPSGTVSCRVDPLSGGGSRITGGAIDERSTHMVTAPSDTSVDVRFSPAVLIATPRHPKKEKRMRLYGDPPLYTYTFITSNNSPSWPQPQVTEERLRQIVREEIAKLPVKFDVPDVPPEDKR